MLVVFPCIIAQVELSHYPPKEIKDNGDTGQRELQDRENSKLEDTTDTQRNRIKIFIKSFISPSIVKVFSVTFANGGDNLGVNIPLFTSMSLVGILVTVIIFILLTALWCFIALKLTERPFVQRNVEKYKNIFVPIIYIGLGIYILMKSGTISLFY